MKLLVFNWRDIKNPAAGGAEVHLHEIFRRLVLRGHAVKLISCGFPGALRTETIDGIVVLRVGTWTTYMLQAPLHYLRHERGRPYDAIVDDVSKVPLMTPLIVRHPLIAIWHMRHGRILFQEAAWPLALLTFLLESLLPRVYRRIPFMVVSQSTKEELAKAGVPSHNIEVIHNGFDAQELGPGAKAEQPLVAYMGRVVRYKRLDHLLKAFAAVAKEVPSARLTIGGRGNDYGRLSNLAKKLEIEGLVEFLGPVTVEGRRRVLQQAWVVANPSMREGWGISVIEANACGTPAVGYDIPGLRDSILDGKTGLLAPNGDLVRLGQALRALLTDHPLRAFLSQQAKEHATRFSWDASAGQTEERLERLAKGSVAPAGES